MDQETKTAEPIKAPAKPKLTKVFDMLEESCRVYAQNFKKFIEIYLRGLVGFIPFVIALCLVVAAMAMNINTNNLLIKGIIIGIMLLSILWAIYYGVRMRAAMVLLIKNDYNSAKESFLESKKYFWGYIWVSLVVTVIIGLWSILFIIPGIIFMAYYMLVNYTFFMEDFKGHMALRRSKELVKGYWWEVLGRLAFIGAAAMIINMIMSFPMTFMVQGGIAYSIYSFFINIIWALLAPIIIIYTYYIFRDLLKIKGESKLEKKPTKKRNIIDAVLVAVVALIFIFIMIISMIYASEKQTTTDNSNYNLDYSSFDASSFDASLGTSTPINDNTLAPVPNASSSLQ